MNITFCINTARNELNHIKLLFKSLKQNLSHKKHEILVFIDSDNEGTFEWLLEQKIDFPNLKILRNNLPICYGYARNINEMFEQASNSCISYLQSDMVICKDYDIEVWEAVEPNTILCSTRIEPPLHTSSGEKHTYDCGLDPTKFDLDKFTKLAESLKEDKFTEYFFAPFTMHKQVWNDIGGHDTMFRRSREDTDILTRLVRNGVQIKQTWRALVYHFTCTSSRGPEWFNKENKEAQERLQLQNQADHIEMCRFQRKWGKFEHTTEPKPYFKIDAHIKGTHPNPDFAIAVMSFFDKIYTIESETYQLVDQYFSQAHRIANKILNISEEDWHRYGYIYNKESVDDFVKMPQEVDRIISDVLIEFDISKLTQEDGLFLMSMQPMIEEYDEDTYEYGPYKIHINKKIDRSSEQIFVHNPSIKKEHLYTIH
tara:strand:+ start:2481 stop:3761 length:1281 start_codon:yes stop_codon:yes gene_type:complete